VVIANQPTIFGDSVVVGMSSVDDGNMKFGLGDDEEVSENRIAFFNQVDIEPTQATLVRVSYATGTNFTRYQIVDDSHLGEGVLEPMSDIHADALVATRPDHALFLPLADCIGAVIFDPITQILMVSHLGRHSLENEGALKSVQYLMTEFDSQPGDILVWLSPSVGSDSYPLHAFGGRSLREVACEQLTTIGIDIDHIEVSEIDTAEDDNYFSHSEYLTGNQMTDGRFAIVAMMRD
jgi:copper oxidase (laccase) domain-containing protein